MTYQTSDFAYQGAGEFAYQEIAGVSARPSGAPGKRFRFNGKYYDSLRDRQRLSRDVSAFLEYQEKQQPKISKPRVTVADIPAPPIVLAESVIAEIDAAFSALDAEMAQRQAYIAQLRAMNEAYEDMQFMLMASI